MRDTRARIQAATTEHSDGSYRRDEEAVRVLFVEDSEDFATLVCTTLSHCPQGSFEIVHTVRLEEALQHISNESYDAVLLDLGLPDSNSEHTIEAATSFARRLPVIVLTGTRSDKLMQEACRAGAQAFIAKDCLVRAELPDTILRAVKRYRRVGLPQPVFCRITN